MKIRRALISVSDKTGIEQLAKGLVEQQVTLVASGGTARMLAKAGIPSIPVSEVTGAPEMLDGRVKTLHPRIHGAILADRRKPHHLAQLKAQGIVPIDLVVCNLYPFSKAVAGRDGSNSQVSEDEAIENIDIGGPAMLRAAAKNYKCVAVVVSPSRYAQILEEMRSRAGALSDETRAALAAEAFTHTAAYDIAISQWMSRPGTFPDKLFLGLDRMLDLRYGENPHQKGSFYAPSKPSWRKLGGKELSFTNLLDFDAAWRLVSEFQKAAVVIVKHTNPCGVATGRGVEEAYIRALESDERSAFGGIVASNRPVDGFAAKRITEIFTEIVIAPGFTQPALEILKTKKNLRIIQMPSPFSADLDLKSAADGYLVQSIDAPMNDRREDMMVAGRYEPKEEDWEDLLFAMAVVKHVKSNAVVFANNEQTVGIGGGQMSRVDAVELAARRAGTRAKGSVCATDGFFPMRDGLDAAVEAGARAIIHPGGSVRDSEIVAAADEHKVPMIFTGRRHFLH
ncbi:MAG: bifunctional phosphoribosylaminoimidazolecarboxamide formyltransferase/IMP cyclohydrolase [Actinomycetota bacterium]|nr:bifunctional phosphoribosylaminoimidazolecarboxamide formyltransferase/IMP cyclohydrolase [Actinomycetota bacterium]